MERQFTLGEFVDAATGSQDIADAVSRVAQQALDDPRGWQAACDDHWAALNAYRVETHAAGYMRDAAEQFVDHVREVCTAVAEAEQSAAVAVPAVA